MTAPSGAPPRRSPVRPIAATGPLAASAVLLMAWWAVAHNSGSGWVQAIGTLLAGVLVVGLAGPAAALARNRLRIVAGPVDATTGLPVELLVTSSTRVRLRPLQPAGPAGFVGPTRDRPAGDDAVDLVFPHRGVVDAVVVEAATAAPFGLLWWSRRVTLPLPAPLHVAPQAGVGVGVPPRADDAAGTAAARVAAATGEPKGVRPYRPGDSRRRVHWPATAHAGTLMVRESEGPSAEPVTVTVTLPTDPDAAEHVAGQALGTTAALLDAALAVVLVTTEPGGTVRAAVPDRRRAGRRLARAVAAGGRGPVGVAVDLGRAGRR